MTKCKKCGSEVEHEGEELCNSCFRDKAYSEEYSKDIASMHRTKNFSAKQTEDYWRKK